MTKQIRNVEAALERSVLRRATQGPDAYQEIREALPARFSAWTDERQHIWTAIHAEYADNGGMTPDTLRARVAVQKPALLDELEAILSLEQRFENADTEKLVDIASRRWLGAQFSKAAEATQSDVSVDELLNNLRRVADIAETGGINREFANDHKQQAEMEEWARSLPESAVEVLIEELHRFIPTFDEGSVNVVAGETGTGKTTLLLALCLMALGQGVRSAYLSTELDGKSTRLLLGAPIFGYDSSRALSQKEMHDHPDFRERVLSRQKDLLRQWGSTDGVSMDGLLITDERSSYTARQVLNAVRFYGRKGVRAIFLDHMHRIRYVGSEPQYVLIENFIKELTNLAKQYRLVVFVGAQCNRREYDTFAAPPIQNLRGSQSIAEETTRTLMVYRPHIAVFTDRKTGQRAMPKSRGKYRYVESESDLRAARKRMRTQQREEFTLTAVPAPGIFGIQIAKDRIAGRNTDQTVLLHFDQGTNRLFSPAPSGQHRWWLTPYTGGWARRV